MGLQMRDDRQMKDVTGLSQAQFDHLLPVFSDIYRTTQQQMYEEGVESGTRQRRPGGGSKGKLPTVADKLQFVLYYYKTYPTFDVLGAQFEMARSKANENLHKLSPVLYDTLVHLELMPYRELATPEDLTAALQGGDQIDIPTKKPRKSKKNPNPQLSDDQKAANKVLSQVRIFIEHAIGGMKRYNILVHVFRNRKANFEDDAIGVCAGLWNFALSY